MTEYRLKIRQYLFLLLIISSDIYADNQVDINLTTNSPCSPAIGINYGKLNINCADPVLEAKVRSLPDLSAYNVNMAQLAELRGETLRIEEKITDLENANLARPADVNKLREQLRKSELQFTELYQEHLQLSSQLASVLAQLPEIIETKINTAIPVISTSIAESILELKIQKYSNNIFFKVDNQLNSQRYRLEKLEWRVNALENDMSYLMNEYLNGQLQNNEFFFGVSIGGLYISKEWQSRISVEFESFLPKVSLFDAKGTFYIGLEKLDWTDSRQYLTFPGVDPINVVDSHKLNLLKLGSRLFFYGWTDHLHSYLGASFGHSMPFDEGTYNYSIGIGTEYFHSSTRVSFELRREEFTDISREDLSFNPFGNPSITTISESRVGWYASIKIAFLL